MVPTNRMRLFRYVALFVATIAALAAQFPRATETAAEPAPPGPAAGILAEAGITGGLIIQIGCDDGDLTAALRAGDTFVVQALDTDADKVAQARRRVRSQGLYGPVSVEQFDGRRLPYADNLANLVVAEQLGDVPTSEVMRVLAPRGVALIGGRKTVKPRPEGIDQWTHFLYDATGNPVAHDSVVGPPRRLQWTEGPRHMRSHEHIPGIYALVSNGPRIFYIVDEAPTDSIRNTPRWELVARDAFNGLLLWKKPVDAWFPHIVNWGQTPPQLERKLVAVGDRVYVTLGLHAPLVALSASTGQTLQVFDDTLGTEEIVFHDGVLLAVVRPVTEQRVAELEKWARLVARHESPVNKRETAEPLVKQLRQTERQGPPRLLALDASSGGLLWKKEGPDSANLRSLSLCAADDRVFFQKGGDVVCLDLKTGHENWAVSAPPLRIVADQTVYCAGKTIAALDARSGQTRWSEPAALVQIRDVFLADGSLWIGGFQPFPTKRGPSWGPYFVNQRDPATGKLLRKIEPDNPGHHHRCYPNKATDRYIVGGRRGTEFIDLNSGDVLWNSWARGVCRYGVMPCNGLLYVPPHACACYMTAKLIGFNALAPAATADAPSPEPDETARLQRGPAYATPEPSPPAPSPLDWPTYRHDAQRSGATDAPVSPRLTPRWAAEVGPRITPPTVAGDRVFVASVDDHRLVALDAASGQPAWEFTAGARVDSPPTLHAGRATFGCRDGCVYSVRTSDGALAWRALAARDQRVVPVNGQIESVWPAHGSVLLRDDVLYATAGRSSYLDGGIDLVRIDPASGRLLSRETIYSPDPDTGQQPTQFGPAAMPGARSDLLSCDAEHVYLQDKVAGSPATAVSEGNPHLFAMTGFLDDAWAHRSYWIFGTKCSVAGGCSSRDKRLVYGRLLVFDESMIYGYGRTNVHWSDQLEDGPYRVFALNRHGQSGQWQTQVPIQVRAMIRAGNVLFLAGAPARPGESPDSHQAGPAALLLALSTADGQELARQTLDSPPLFDGMAAAAGRLYVALDNGQIVCLEQPDGKR